MTIKAKEKAKQGALEFSAATLVAVILGALFLIFGILLLSGLLKFPLEKEKPAPLFDYTRVFPEQGRPGTIFSIRFYSTSNTSYIVHATILNETGEVGKIMLYDDGAHGDEKASDGFYANVWDSSGRGEGPYYVNINIELPQTTQSYEKAAEFEIYKENCIALIRNGKPDERIDITFLGVGYNETSSLAEDVAEYIDYYGKGGGLFSVSPYKENRERFNFYFVNESADLGCGLGYGEIASVVRCDDNKVMELASQCPSDQVIVLIKSEEFCGSASSYAKICTGKAGKDVLLHELGHTLAGLGDEYEYDKVYPGFSVVATNYQFPNCDVAQCKKWQGIEGTACFKGCGLSELFRPTKNSCIMYGYTHKFCPVCARTILNLITKYKKGKANETLMRPAPVPPTEKSYLVSLDKERNTLAFKDVFVTTASAPDRKIVRRVDYSAALLAFDGSTLYKFDFEMPDMLFPFYEEGKEKVSPFILEKSSQTIVIPYFRNAKTLEIYEKNRTILRIDLGYFAKVCGDNICEPHENWFECPADCPLAAPDNICAYLKDNVCDPDCPERDPDCMPEKSLIFGILVSGIAVLVIIVAILISRKHKI